MIFGMASSGMFREKNCKVCGKGFSYFDKWGYSIGSKYFCSYKCMREFENNEIERKRIAHEKLLERNRIKARKQYARKKEQSK